MHGILGLLFSHKSPLTSATTDEAPWTRHSTDQRSGGPAAEEHRHTHYLQQKDDCAQHPVHVPPLPHRRPEAVQKMGAAQKESDQQGYNTGDLPNVKKLKKKKVWRDTSVLLRDQSCVHRVHILQSMIVEMLKTSGLHKATIG